MPEPKEVKPQTLGYILNIRRGKISGSRIDRASLLCFGGIEVAGTGTTFNGSIAEARAINGTAISSDQISIEYDNQSEPNAWWIAADAGGGGASAAVTIPKPVFSSAAQSIAPIFNAAVSFTVSKPVFASTAQSVAPGNNGDVSFLIAKPVFASTAQSRAMLA